MKLPVLLKNIQTSLTITLHPTEFQSHSVADCIKQAVEKYQYLYQALPSLTLHLQQDFMFWGEDAVLSHLILNLLDNTRVHAGPNVAVSIAIKENKIYYKDNGPGISPLHLPYIFHRFYSTTGSLGLGLNYAKKALQAFQGDIICKTQTAPCVDTYTSFIITLPPHSPEA